MKYLLRTKIKRREIVYGRFKELLNLLGEELEAAASVNKGTV